MRAKLVQGPVDACDVGLGERGAAVDFDAGPGPGVSGGEGGVGHTLERKVCTKPVI